MSHTLYILLQFPITLLLIATSHQHGPKSIFNPFPHSLDSFAHAYLELIC